MSQDREPNINSPEALLQYRREVLEEVAKKLVDCKDNPKMLMQIIVWEVIRPMIEETTT